jgi:putative hydrolase of the HAD superfamily
MNIEAVIFDWGGTLTPWHIIDLKDQWMAYAQVYDPENADQLAENLLTAEQSRWSRQFNSQGATGTGTLDSMFQEQGIDTSSALHQAGLQSYLDAWDPHTFTDAQVIPLMEALRGQGIRTAVLSNTMWPRRHHEWVLERDGVLHLFDYLLFTSEIETGKPHRSVFTQVSYNLDVEPSKCAFVGDRLFDDIHGCQEVGMKGIWVPHSKNIPAAESTDLGITPDATIEELIDVLAIVNEWNAN